MSLMGLDGGGDPGGGKTSPTGGGNTGFDPTGGSNPLGMDPSLTGGWDPLSNLGAGMGGSGAWGGPPDGGAAANPINDPNVGAPQSQQPAPGQSQTSYGGVQSGPQDTNLQNLVNQLTQRGGGQGAGTPPPTLTQIASRGDIASDAPQPGVSDSGIAPTTQPLSMDALQGRTDGQPATPTGPTTAAATAPQGNVPVGATGEPIPPSTSTTPTPPTATSPGQPPPGGASPEPAVDRPPPPPPKADTTPPPADTTTPPAAKTGATPPAAAPNAADPLSGPGGSYGGGSPTQQQQLTPGKLIGDVVKALFGDPSGLLQDIAGGAGAGDWESPGNPPGVPPWAPGYGPQSRINPNSPEARRIAAQGGRAGGRRGGGRAGTPPQDNTPQGPTLAQQQGDVQAAIAKGERDPFGAQGWPEQGKDPLAPSFAPRGSTLDAWKNSPAVAGNRLYAHPGGQLNQQIAAQPAGNINGNFGQPFDQNLANDREPIRRELQAKPWLARHMMDVANHEQGRSAQGAQGIMETMVNRARMTGESLEQVSRWYNDGGYYDDRGGRRLASRATLPMLQTGLNNVLNGANITNYATDNDSQEWGWNRSHGMYQMDSTYGGEYFSHPARSDASGFRQYPGWLRRVQGGAGPQSSLTPPARATGPDMLRGRTQVAGLERPGMSPGAMSQATDPFDRFAPGPEDAMRDVNRPPETTSDPRYEPSWMTGVDPNLTIENLDRPPNGAPGS